MYAITAAVLVAEAIPFSAWEQIAAICLFAVFVWRMLAWFGKQSNQWQEFIIKIDDKWREFNKAQREENNCAMAEVKDAVSNLTTVTQGLVSEVKEMREASSQFYTAFENHDDQAKKILSTVEQVNTAASGRRATKPRET